MLYSTLYTASHNDIGDIDVGQSRVNQNAGGGDSENVPPSTRPSNTTPNQRQSHTTENEPPATNSTAQEPQPVASELEMLRGTSPFPYF